MKKKSTTFPKLDMSVLIGLIGAFTFIALGIGFYTSFKAFINWPALFIVIGGTLCISIISFSPKDALDGFIRAFRLIIGIEQVKTTSPNLIIRASEIVHTNGLLTLQKNYIPNLEKKSFWSDGLNLLIDGITGNECEQMMRGKMLNNYSAQMNAVSFLNKMAETAPAMGLIGTLVGLVQMLSTLSDPTTIGPAMAVAMLTTFYGAIFAYLICQPLASRLEQIAQKNLLSSQLCLVGFKAVDKAQNPRKTQMELNALLPKEQQLNYFEG